MLQRRPCLKGIESRNADKDLIDVPDEWKFKATLIRLLILFAYPITTYYLIFEIRRGNWASAGLDVLFMILFLVASYYLGYIQ